MSGERERGSVVPADRVLPGGGGIAPGDGEGGHPLEEITRILNPPPIITAEGLRGGVILTRRWTHGAVHTSMPPMRAHVIAAHYGGDAPVSLRSGSLRLESTTRSGTILIVPQGREGRWDVDGAPDISQVYLTEERLQASAEALTRGRHVELLDRVGYEDATVWRILSMLCEETNVSDRSARLFLEQAIDLLCLQLVRTHSCLGATAAQRPRRGLADWQVKRVTAYMRAMLEDDVGLNELAALVNLSRHHFCTAFRLATGCTPHEWLTGLRISRAKELLVDPGLRVTDIALSVGYQTPSSFTASFRKLVGVTPTEFRRRL